MPQGKPTPEVTASGDTSGAVNASAAFMWERKFSIDNADLVSAFAYLHDSDSALSDDMFDIIAFTETHCKPVFAGQARLSLGTDGLSFGADIDTKEIWSMQPNCSLKELACTGAIDNDMQQSILHGLEAKGLSLDGLTVESFIIKGPGIRAGASIGAGAGFKAAAKIAGVEVVLSSQGTRFTMAANLGVGAGVGGRGKSGKSAHVSYGFWEVGTTPIDGVSRTTKRDNTMPNDNNNAAAAAGSDDSEKSGFVLGGDPYIREHIHTMLFGNETGDSGGAAAAAAAGGYPGQFQERVREIEGISAGLVKEYGGLGDLLAQSDRDEAAIARRREQLDKGFNQARSAFGFMARIPNRHIQRAAIAGEALMNVSQGIAHIGRVLTAGGGLLGLTALANPVSMVLGGITSLGSLFGCRSSNKGMQQMMKQIQKMMQQLSEQIQINHKQVMETLQAVLTNQDSILRNLHLGFGQVLEELSLQRGQLDKIEGHVLDMYGDMQRYWIAISHQTGAHEELRQSLLEVGSKNNVHKHLQRALGNVRAIVENPSLTPENSATGKLSGWYHLRDLKTLLDNPLFRVKHSKASQLIQWSELHNLLEIGDALKAFANIPLFISSQVAASADMLVTAGEYQPIIHSIESTITLFRHKLQPSYDLLSLLGSAEFVNAFLDFYQEQFSEIRAEMEVRLGQIRALSSEGTQRKHAAEIIQANIQAGVGLDGGPLTAIQGGVSRAHLALARQHIEAVRAKVKIYNNLADEFRAQMHVLGCVFNAQDILSPEQFPAKIDGHTYAGAAQHQARDIHGREDAVVEYLAFNAENAFSAFNPAVPQKQAFKDAVARGGELLLGYLEGFICAPNLLQASARTSLALPAPDTGGAAAAVQAAEFDELHGHLHELEKRVSTIKGKQAIFLFGVTGAGKSTLANVLQGSEYREDFDGLEFCGGADEVCSTSDSGQSETVWPHVTIPADDKPYRIIDLPGTLDNTQGKTDEQKAVMSLAPYFVQRAASQPRAVIWTIPFSAIKERGDDKLLMIFKQLLRITNPAILNSSLIIVISKVDSKYNNSWDEKIKASFKGKISAGGAAGEIKTEEVSDAEREAMNAIIDNVWDQKRYVIYSAPEAVHREELLGVLDGLEPQAADAFTFRHYCQRQEQFQARLAAIYENYAGNGAALLSIRAGMQRVEKQRQEVLALTAVASKPKTREQLAAELKDVQVKIEALEAAVEVFEPSYPMQMETRKVKNERTDMLWAGGPKYQPHNDWSHGGTALSVFYRWIGQFSELTFTHLETGHFGGPNGLYGYPIKLVLAKKINDEVVYNKTFHGRRKHLEDIASELVHVVNTHSKKLHIHFSGTQFWPIITTVQPAQGHAKITLEHFLPFGLVPSNIEILSNSHAELIGQADLSHGWRQDIKYPIGSGYNLKVRFTYPKAETPEGRLTLARLQVQQHQLQAQLASLSAHSPAHGGAAAAAAGAALDSDDRLAVLKRGEAQWLEFFRGKDTAKRWQALREFRAWFIELGLGDAQTLPELASIEELTQGSLTGPPLLDDDFSKVASAIPSPSQSTGGPQFFNSPTKLQQKLLALRKEQCNVRSKDSVAFHFPDLKSPAGIELFREIQQQLHEEYQISKPDTPKDPRELEALPSDSAVGSKDEEEEVLVLTKDEYDCLMGDGAYERLFPAEVSSASATKAPSM